MTNLVTPPLLVQGSSHLINPIQMSRSILKFAALLVLVPMAVQAQSPRALPKPDAEFEEPFTTVSSLRELRNGRVMVADARDKLLQLVDLTSGTASKIGREGSGPGEFTLPMRLVGAPGDTTILFDPGNQRYLVIGPDAKPVTTFRLDAPARPGNGPVTLSFSPPRGSDARGRIYFEGPGVSPGPDGRPITADSAPIIRYDRATSKRDTVAWVRLAKANTQVSGSQDNVRMIVGAANPFAPRDEWTVFGDGRVAVVRHHDYHVDWYSADGRKSSSAPNPFSVIRVTEADKKEATEARDRARRGGGMMVVTTTDGGPGGARTQVGTGGGANAPAAPPITDWPATKPPFQGGMNTVLARPNGELWVRRTRAAGLGQEALYDVLNAQGKVTHSVVFPKGVNWVGFGNGTIYTTRADSDDLLYLQRHRGI